MYKYISFKRTLWLIKADCYRHVKNESWFSVFILLLNPCFGIVFWSRLLKYFKQRKIIFFPAWLVSYFIQRRLRYKLGCMINPDTEIGPGFYIGHGLCTIVGRDCVIGANVNISQGVTLGAVIRGNKVGRPIIGNNVYIGAGAKVLGKITIGNNVAIGANAVVIKDVPDNAVVGGVPAKVLNFNGSESYVHNPVKFED